MGEPPMPLQERMMAEAYDDLTNVRAMTYKVLWGSAQKALGFCDDIDPSGLKLKTRPIQIGSLGDVELGQRIVGIEGSIKIQFREAVLDLMQTLNPAGWTSGSIALHGTAGDDLYDRADILRLHPRQIGDDDASEDVVLLKAAPITLPLLKRGGKNDDLWEVEFVPFPDRGEFPDIVYGWIGNPPA